MSEYFPEPKSSGGRVKVELDLSNYATKADLKNATGVNTSKKSDVVKKDLVKKDVYNAKIKYLINLAANTTLNAKINEVKIEIRSITNLASTTAVNAKINEVKI